jgi:hypothetical protein
MINDLFVVITIYSTTCHLWQCIILFHCLPFAVVHHIIFFPLHVICCSDLYIPLRLDLTHHYSHRLLSLHSKVRIWRVDVLICEEWGVCSSTIHEGNTLLWRRSASTTSLILDFRCIGFSLVVCVLWTLQMQRHYIHVGFERGGGGLRV